MHAEELERLALEPIEDLPSVGEYQAFSKLFDSLRFVSDEEAERYEYGS